MAYEQQRDELSKVVADSLLNLAVEREYPLHPGMGFWGFTQGIQDCGVQVDFNAKSKSAKFHFEIEVSGKKYSVPVERPYNHLIAGSGSVPGSPDAFLDSTMDLLFASELSLHDTHRLELNEGQLRELELYFSAQKDKFEKAMQTTWSEFFVKYHENCLVSVEGGISTLTRSSLLPVVLNDENVSDYAEVCRENFKGGREKDEFQTFISDIFLTELATLNGYPIQSRNPRKIEYDPLDVFVHGHNIVWKNLENLLV